MEHSKKLMNEVQWLWRDQSLCVIWHSFLYHRTNVQSSHRNFLKNIELLSTILNDENKEKEVGYGPLLKTHDEYLIFIRNRTGDAIGSTVDSSVPSTIHFLRPQVQIPSTKSMLLSWFICLSHLLLNCAHWTKNWK